MANILNKFLGGGGVKPPRGGVPSSDPDFANFVAAPNPTPAPLVPEIPTLDSDALAPAATARPYTKWYKVHERHSLSEFRGEGIILAAIAVVLLIHVFGTRLNRNKAQKWIHAHAKPLAQEFTLVGPRRSPPRLAECSGEAHLTAAYDDNIAQGGALLREDSPYEFTSYATGRANVAFVDVKLTLQKRFNPFIVVTGRVLGLFIESVRPAVDTLDTVLYLFDGKESALVPKKKIPNFSDVKQTKENKSGFDGFVWAIVNKDCMKQLRDDRYDVSLTVTKDSPKLPNWLTIMSESAEITDVMLTRELTDAVVAAGDKFAYLIVSDQPIVKPRSLDEVSDTKRIFLKYRLPSDDNYEPLQPIFRHFLRLGDHLAQAAHFRAEVVRKVKSTREDAIRHLQKVAATEQAEERAAERERLRKAKRDAELSALDAKAQKKYLEREREKGMRKMGKRQTMRG